VLRFRFTCASRSFRQPSEGQGASHLPLRSGITLLELVIVIVILGLILALVAPSMMTPASKPESELGMVLETARRAAVVRAQPVTLSIDASGAWRVDADVNPSPTSISSGTLGTPIGALRVHVSAMGTCVGEPSETATTINWNALDCRPAQAESRR
jgi:prepilin-type N-terminal cleavage/methylation domain-containing protein